MSSPYHETETLIAYLRGELRIEEVRELEVRLREDESLRRSLIELSTEEAALTEWAKTERASASLDDKTFSSAAIPDTTMANSRNAPPLAGWWTAAAILLLSAFGFFFLNRAETPIAEEPGVAHLVASVDADWRNVTPTLHKPLATGTYELESGSIDLLFADGARVSVSGPARFDLRSTRHIHLDSGNLVAQIPDEALGFLVTSPQSEVVDLGTEFGLSVDDSGLTDVHVIDGLVEVRPAERQDVAPSPGIMIGEGEARRFSKDPDTNAIEIPVSSRAGLMGQQRSNELGLDMLRGSVRVVDHISRNDLFDVSEGPNWIDLAVEQRGVPITEPLEVSIDAPGSYRNFANLRATLPPGRTIHSYLLHFRPNSFSHVSGVIRFDQPIVGILCTGKHLRQTDGLFGVPTVYYPSKSNAFQGLEPNGSLPAGKQNPTEPWVPDVIVLSQDRTTISIRTYAGIDRGYDQIRILTAAEAGN